jgi:hypothetical protein
MDIDLPVLPTLTRQVGVRIDRREQESTEVENINQDNEHN